MSATATEPRRYRLLAVNDEQSTCCCCGKKGLKRVVWLLDLEEPDADPAHYGTTCAAHLLMNRKAGEPKPKVSAAEKAIAAAIEFELTRVAAELLTSVPVVVPELTEGINKWGVPVVICGDTEVPFSFESYNRRVPFAAMVERVIVEWKLDTVSAVARDRGLESWRVRAAAARILAA
jgi:hypothetical protein